MTVYVVIINSRRPNLLALSHMSDRILDSVRPLIEIVARADDESPKVAVQRVLSEIHRNRLLDKSIDFALDTRPLAGRFGPSGAYEALRLLVADLGVGSFRPVIHTDEAPEHLEEVRRATEKLHTGVCLRVRRPFAFNLSDSRVLLDQLEAVGETAERTDLVLDCGYFTSASETCTDVGGPLRHLLDIAWQSVTVAGGSFPSTENLVKPAAPEVRRIPRREADLRCRISQLWNDVSYGDYGVDHPGPPPADDKWPPPNLRYTVGRQWSLYYWPKGTSRGNKGFFELCKRLVGSSDWPTYGTDFSWGDQQIARAACKDGGPGGSTEWKAYSLSHHLAAVVGMLREEACRAC
ncbi:beta family protein [Nonomuraea sp. NPDC004297]